MSVKMDMKFTKKDFKILGIVALLFFGIPLLINIGSNIAIGVGDLLSGASLGSIQEISNLQSPNYYIITSLFFIVGLLLVTVYRKVSISRKVKKCLRDRFYEPKPPRSKKFMYGWFIVVFLVSNVSYLIYSA